MKNQALVILTITSICWLTLFGCAPSGGSSSQIAKLQGTWVSGCWKPTSFYRKDSYTFSGTDMSASITLYDDAACSNQMNQVDIAWSDIRTGDNITIDNQTLYQISYTLMSRNYTAVHTDMVDIINNISWCGKTDWALDVVVDTLGFTCQSGSNTLVYPSKGSTVYNIFSIEGSEVRFGNNNLYHFPTDQYPTEIYEADTAVFIKQ